MTKDTLSKYISDKRVSGSLIERLARLSADERAELGVLVERSNPSANTLRGFLRLADEISGRDGVGLCQLLADSGIRFILADEQLSRKEKQKNIREKLEEVRYPEIKKIKNMLAVQRDKLIKDVGLRVDLPKDLEGDTISLTLSARSGEQFCKLGDKLRDLGRHPATEEIFSLLKGQW